MTKLKNSNGDKTQIVTKLNLWKKRNYSKCDKTQIRKKVNNSNCDKTQNSNCDKSQKLYLWQNLNYNKSQFMRRKNLQKGLLVGTFWHLDNRWDVLWAVLCNSRDVCQVSTKTLRKVKPETTTDMSPWPARIVIKARHINFSSLSPVGEFRKRLWHWNTEKQACCTGADPSRFNSTNRPKTPLQ